jgi:lysozyme family protein
MDALPPLVAKIIEETIQREGGYSDNPNDKGGKTRFGVTEVVARAHGYTGEMRLFPIERAREIYAETYWTGPGFHRVLPLMPRLAEELFDTGVNMGTGRAAGFLQRALNALNRQGKDYPDIAVDNQVGPRSAGSLFSFQQRRGKDAETVLLRLVEGFQATRYVELCEARQPNEEFLFGWVFNRVGNLQEKA